MAIYDKSQITPKESECDAKTNLVEKNDCYTNLIGQYKEIINSNNAALNADANNSGTYDLLKALHALDRVTPNNSLKSQIAATESEIAVRQGRVADANYAIQSLQAKINTNKTAPTYAQQYAAKSRKNLIWWGIAIVIFVGLIVVAVRIYKKRKG